MDFKWAALVLECGELKQKFTGGTDRKMYEFF